MQIHSHLNSWFILYFIFVQLLSPPDNLTANLILWKLPQFPESKYMKLLTSAIWSFFPLLQQSNGPFSSLNPVLHLPLNSTHSHLFESQPKSIDCTVCTLLCSFVFYVGLSPWAHRDSIGNWHFSLKKQIDLMHTKVLKMWAYTHAIIPLL